MTSSARAGLRKVRELAEPPRILVVGDVMLDRFVWGDVQRISPEAPVPVVKVRKDSSRPGGAANVAANLASLSARVRLVGCIGRDDAGAELRSILASTGIEDRLVDDPERTTTVKTRILAQAQQVVRVDREDEPAVGSATAARLLESARSALGDADGVIVSDYDKGAVGPSLLEGLLGEARDRGVPVVVDPKPANVAHYQPITVITPNQAEAALATACEIRSDDDCVGAARSILERLDTRAVLVTRGDRGMLLLERDSVPAFIPAEAREVYDVTGAGDTVVAVLSLALASGATLREAAWLANRAAGVVVGKVGTARIGLDELESTG